MMHGQKKHKNLKVKFSIFCTEWMWLYPLQEAEKRVCNFLYNIYKNRHKTNSCDWCPFWFTRHIAFT